MTLLKKITIGLILASSSLMVNAQQKTLAKFIITDASVNGVDYTPAILDNGAYTVFYLAIPRFFLVKD